jgi:nucleoside 2-deoxyribosyltransferase
MVEVYFAGPDVFKPDYPKIKEIIRELCKRAGINPLLPGDDDALSDPSAIFEENIKLIERADGLIANLEPWKGVIEPDSGTVFEVGYGYALSKWIIGYLPDRRDVASKLKGTSFGPQEHDNTCSDGSMVENFGLPLNLMPALALNELAANLTEAIEKAGKLVKDTPVL